MKDFAEFIQALIITIILVGAVFASFYIAYLLVGLIVVLLVGAIVYAVVTRDKSKSWLDD